MICIMGALAAGSVVDAAAVPKTRVYIDALLPGLPAAPVHTLGRVEGAGRQLLSLRAYLRAGESLESR